MTYGRSGSTLLMGLLNTIPGYLIRGENDDAMRFLYEFHQTCVERSTFWPIERMRMRSNPFFGMGDFPVAASLAGPGGWPWRPCCARRPTPGSPASRRSAGGATTTSTRTSRGCGEVFPGARFLVNTREHQAVLRSKWWAKGGDKSHHLADIEHRLLATSGRLTTRRTTSTSTTTSPTPPHWPRCSRGWVRSTTRPSVSATMSRKHSV